MRYIEGNRNHPVNKGVLCGKGSAGIMQHYSPARLRKPLLRVGERGAGEFKEIEWEEALAPRHRVAWRDARYGAAASWRCSPGATRASPDRLVGQAVRHAEFRRAWRVLLGQHGGGRAVSRSAAVSGSSASRTGSAPNTC